MELPIILRYKLTTAVHILGSIDMLPIVKRKTIIMWTIILRNRFPQLNKTPPSFLNFKLKLVVSGKILLNKGIKGYLILV